ncbi:hypothetical protein [Pendulispora albinea]|uniref:DUF4292 domain-containing protein n=1 Tax=Pendulispora albinea TaxID=2741071 RepID=A0ABZ2LR04_9BACT
MSLRPFAQSISCALLSLAVAGTTGCASAPPPASQFPSVEAAVERMHATTSSCVAVQAKAKIDHFGKQGRLRGDLLMMVAVPARIRMDIVSPFGVTVATLTSDGRNFSLADLRDKRFYTGPAKACNIARLTTVPVPGPVLVDLLRGEAPILKHGLAAGLSGPNTGSRIAWSGDGYYVITLTGANATTEEIHLAPRPDDLAKPWTEQRLRVLEVTVRQQGLVLYRAELEDHASTPMSTARVDEQGIDPPIPPSGPVCTAELPRRIHVVVPGLKEDVIFRYDDVLWNPPLPRDIFTQPQPAGLQPFPVNCEE